MFFCTGNALQAEKNKQILISKYRNNKNGIIGICWIWLRQCPWAGCTEASAWRLPKVAERIQGRGRREGMLSKHLPLKIPQKHLFSAYVFRFAGPPASLWLRTPYNKPQQRAKASIPPLLSRSFVQTNQTMKYPAHTPHRACTIGLSCGFCCLLPMSWKIPYCRLSYILPQFTPDISPCPFLHSCPMCLHLIRKLPVKILVPITPSPDISCRAACLLFSSIIP